MYLAKSLPMKRERAEGDGEGSKLFHRLGSIRSSLRLDSASSSSSRRMGAEMLDAERALTSHLVMQETLRVQAREGKGDPDLIP
ncbi:unnamed protein product [Darwinula stevensoni]|uniref:Uncharacterized protein n=1 Tax=Darwinula stevensoni TaxID=69355 RepID=A0A7R9ACZ2_9CRUS|nr:unnamed protein product [Darwinula stevensoni]CAG0900549.1 unnamed protein product [Darwinula stevensoni]